MPKSRWQNPRFKGKWSNCQHFDWNLLNTGGSCLISLKLSTPWTYLLPMEQLLDIPGTYLISLELTWYLWNLLYIPGTYLISLELTWYHSNLIDIPGTYLITLGWNLLDTPETYLIPLLASDTRAVLKPNSRAWKAVEAEIGICIK